MKVGTKSLLYGAHAWWHHPIILAIAWTKLYGIPWDPRLWCCFFLHDIGYFGLDKMDDDVGECHPIVGASCIRRLFGNQWGDFCLFHSRFMARRLGKPYSRLCVADKLAFVITPTILYLPCTWLSGELAEYRADRHRYTDERLDHSSVWSWHRTLREHIYQWVLDHKDCTNKDTI